MRETHVPDPDHPGFAGDEYVVFNQSADTGRWAEAARGEVSHSPGQLKTWAACEPAATYPQRAAMRDYEAAMESRQPKLFGEDYIPGESTIIGLFTTESSRAQALPLVGLMEHHAQTEHGRSVLPSTNTSPHSTRMVA